MRLGRSLEGEIIRIDTTRPQTTLLLGDPGIGKTTLCRYVVRWWLARTAEHVVVGAARRAEWADLSECSRLSLHDLWAEPARSLLEAEHRVGLWIFDGLQNAGSGFLRSATDRDAMVMVTALSAWGSDPAQDVARWGLTVQFPNLVAEPAVADPTQARLDWGCGTDVLVPDICGAGDFPRHRWHEPESRPGRAMVGAR